MMENDDYLILGRPRGAEEDWTIVAESIFAPKNIPNARDWFLEEVEGVRALLSQKTTAQTAKRAASDLLEETPVQGAMPGAKVNAIGVFVSERPPIAQAVQLLHAHASMGLAHGAKLPGCLRRASREWIVAPVLCSLASNFSSPRFIDWQCNRPLAFALHVLIFQAVAVCIIYTSRWNATKERS